MEKSDGANFADGDDISLVIEVFAYTFKNPTSAITQAIESKKSNLPVLLRQLREFLQINTDIYLSAWIKNDEDEIIKTLIKRKLHRNIKVAANKRKIFRQLPLDYVFVFCRTIKNGTKRVDFHITFKTAN